MNDSEKFDEMVAENIWHENLDEVIETIKKLSASGSGWSWVRSKDWNCKYISLHFDMRDGAFTIQGRDGKRISLEQLKYQYNSEEKK